MSPAKSRKKSGKAGKSAEEEARIRADMLDSFDEVAVSGVGMR